MVADVLGCDCYAILNFTWKDQYERLEISKDIIDRFVEVNDSIAHYIRYVLSFGDATNGCKVSNVGFTCRTINHEFVKEIKGKFISEIFLALGKSALINNVKIKNMLEQ